VRASDLLDPFARASLSAADAAPLRATLDGGLHAVYVVMTAVAVVGAFFAMRLPARLEVADVPLEARGPETIAATGD
jgi:hypothetical protein